MVRSSSKRKKREMLLSALPHTIWERIVIGKSGLKIFYARFRRVKHPNPGSATAPDHRPTLATKCHMQGKEKAHSLSGTGNQDLSHSHTAS